MNVWHAKDAHRTLAELDSDGARGLSAREAARRLASDGPNELTEGRGRSPWHILREQVTATMVLILVGAAVISAALGDRYDAIAIGAIVVLFVALGFVQEYRAEKAMAALKRLAVPTVRVLRDGEVGERSARELVAGDVVLLEAGNVVPADLRLLEVASLKIQEATLTGEAEAVEKSTAPLAQADLPLGDRTNLAFMGTLTTYGRGSGVVVATGMRTELGRIATLLGGLGAEATPLQARLDQLGKVLAVVGVAVAALVAVLGMLRGESLRHMLLTAVAIAVAVVPEGLPAVVTITLALGAQRMLKRRALIRKLPAVETLGSVTVICSDKTGTLTENRMTVTVVDLAGSRIEISETMRHRQPSAGGGDHDRALAEESPQLGMLLAAGALCNDARLVPSSQPGSWHAHGDPTEGALLVAAARFGLERDALTAALPRVAERPFDSERKRMTTVHTPAGPLPAVLARGLGPLPRHLAFTKGAIDGLLAVSTRVLASEEVEPISQAWRDRILASHDELAASGLRVLGLACRPLPGDLPAPERLEEDLVLIGLVGMLDPPRAGVREAVARCVSAGISPKMITGDHPLTAREIACELGIDAGQVLTGQEVERMSSAELEAVVEPTSVFARSSPEHKLRIVQALQARGHIVAMTGDGVNDAPALKKADIGLAMGITGTDVAKEAADMVLLDDNFSTIVAAVEEGRTIYDNIRRFVKFSVAGNIGKVAVMVLAPLLGKPLPLSPLQLLWLNLLTDGLLGLGLGLEPPERGVMSRPPYPPDEGVFARGTARHTIWVGAFIGLVANGVGTVLWLSGHPAWQTVVFTTLAFLQVAQALGVRSVRESLFTLGPLSNPTLAALVALTVGLQLAVVYVPPLQVFFEVDPLSLRDLGLCVGLAGALLAAIELEKWSVRRRATRLG